jgi:hypothetical protein
VYLLPEGSEFYYRCFPQTPNIVIISENTSALEHSRLGELRCEMYIRAIAGLVFAASSALSLVNAPYGRAAFAATVFMVFLQIALSRLAPSRRAR